MATVEREELLEELEDHSAIGPVLAERIYDAVDPSSLDDVRDFVRTSKFEAVKGIGRSRSQKIRKSLGVKASATDGQEPFASNRQKVLGKLRCPHCHQPEFTYRNNGLYCTHCERNYRTPGNIIDFLGDGKHNQVPIQALMESGLYANYYETVFRPFLTWFVSSRSLSEEYALSTQYLDLDPDSDLLDVGCGTGNFTRYFARSRDSETTDGKGCMVGLDVSRSMLKKAQANTRYEGLQSEIEFLRADATALPLLDNSFSHVHCSGAFHLMQNFQQAAQNFARVLKPGGTLVLGTFLVGPGVVRPLIKQASEFVSDFHWFTREELFDLLTRTGFKVRDESILNDAVTLRAERI
ncbi:MAG: methyltransferase domain-containing protein [bacterium]